MAHYTETSYTNNIKNYDIIHTDSLHNILRIMAFGTAASILRIYTQSIY